MLGKLVGMAVLSAVVLTTGVASAGDDILYWMVDDSATITTDAESSPPTTATIGDFFGNIGRYFPDLASEGSAFAARVRVTGGDIQDGQDVFLDLYIPGYGLDEGGGEYGVAFSEVGGYWGAGVPTGNQSPSDVYSAGSPEYSFIVELGNIDSSDNWTTVNWTTVATSASATYSSLGAYIHETFDINPGQIAVWTPTQFTMVPEPTSGLLTVFGIALLALRRRKAG